MLVLTTFISCSPDGPENDNVQNISSSNKLTGEYPENPANEYDIAGDLNNTLTEAWLAKDVPVGDVVTVLSEVEALANLNSDFLDLKPTGYVSPTVKQIEYILADEEQSALDIISNSSLSPKARFGLATFIDSLMAFRASLAEYEVIHKYIVGYEDSIINDATLLPNDKRIILTTTSVSRHAIYFAKKKKRPRDRDWEISWGNIVAPTEGSEDSMANAVIMSVVTGIMLND